MRELHLGSSEQNSVLEIKWSLAEDAFCFIADVSSKPLLNVLSCLHLILYSLYNPLGFHVASMHYCMYSSSVCPKTEIENGSVKWVKLLGNAKVSLNTYTCVDAIPALKNNSANLCMYSI